MMHSKQLTLSQCLQATLQDTKIIFQQLISSINCTTNFKPFLQSFLDRFKIAFKCNLFEGCNISFPQMKKITRRHKLYQSGFSNSINMRSEGIHNIFIAESRPKSASDKNPRTLSFLKNIIKQQQSRLKKKSMKVHKNAIPTKENKKSSFSSLIQRNMNKAIPRLISIAEEKTKPQKQIINEVLKDTVLNSKPKTAQKWIECNIQVLPKVPQIRSQQDNRNQQVKKQDSREKLVSKEINKKKQTKDLLQQKSDPKNEQKQKIVNKQQKTEENRVDTQKAFRCKVLANAVKIVTQELRSYKISWVYPILIYKAYYFLHSSMNHSPSTSSENQQIKSGLQVMLKRLKGKDAERQIFKIKKYDDFIEEAIPLLYSFWEDLFNRGHQFTEHFNAYQEFLLCLGWGMLICHDGPAIEIELDWTLYTQSLNKLTEKRSINPELTALYIKLQELLN